MAEPRMCGVVLWASEDEGRAVIWCEDHGNLAFYKASECDLHGGPNLDPGDLIDFDLEDQAEHRLAYNPRLLVQDHSPAIASGLRQGARKMDVMSKMKKPAQNDNVVPMPLRNQRAGVEFSVA